MAVIGNLWSEAPPGVRAFFERAAERKNAWDDAKVLEVALLFNRMLEVALLSNRMLEVALLSNRRLEVALLSNRISKNE